MLDASTGREWLRLEHRSPEVISRLVFSRDSRHLAVLNETGVMHLWDLAALRRSMESEGFGRPEGLRRMGRAKGP